MTELLVPLIELQREISNQSDFPISHPNADRVLFAQVGSLLHISFIGNPHDQPFNLFLSALNNPNIAHNTLTLSFSGPDEGANGTKHWDFTLLSESNIDFPQLISLEVERTSPENHNTPIIGQVYEENGMIAKLVDKTPKLEILRVPSAPNELFFSRIRPTLTYLAIDAGYHHQNFLINLAHSHSLPRLRVLEYGELPVSEEENSNIIHAPFHHYISLFQSSAFDSVRSVTLRNTVCTMEQLTNLKSLRPNIVMRVIRNSGNYVK